jgi:hypothetical protein
MTCQLDSTVCSGIALPEYDDFLTLELLWPRENCSSLSPNNITADWGNKPFISLAVQNLTIKLVDPFDFRKLWSNFRARS